MATTKKSKEEQWKKKDEQFQKWQELIARDEIQEFYEEAGVKKTKKELDKLAHEAVEAYFNDNIRAECWMAAIESVCGEIEEGETE